MSITSLFCCISNAIFIVSVLHLYRNKWDNSEGNIIYSTFINKMKKAPTIMLAFILLLSIESFAGKTIKLATTTSTYETGILEYIFPSFEKAYNVKVHIISAGTGKAIKLGENGDVDIILVHARMSEDKFVTDGYGVNRRDVMYNDFIILGPEEDPAHIRGLDDSKGAFKKIYKLRYPFISRGDDSGTHKKEKYIWSKTSLDPKGEWYQETGQGMSATLRIADEKNAYVMLDRATYLFNKETIRLKILCEGDKDLLNPYGIIAVSPYIYAHVEYELAIAMIAWMTSPECQKMINNYKLKGQQLYHSSAAFERK